MSLTDVEYCSIVRLTNPVICRLLFSHSGSHESLLLTVYLLFCSDSLHKTTQVKTWQKCAGLWVCHLRCFLFWQILRSHNVVTQVWQYQGCFKNANVVFNRVKIWSSDLIHMIKKQSPNFIFTFYLSFPVSCDRKLARPMSGCYICFPGSNSTKHSLAHQHYHSHRLEL